MQLRKFTRPHPNNYEPAEMVIKRISTEYSIQAQRVPMLFSLPEETKSEDRWPREILVHVYKTGSIYHILAYNDSLQLYCEMLRAVLDDEQQKQFDMFYENVEYQKALELLTNNSF